MSIDPIEIYVLDKKVRLLQPASGFRTSLDSVMLAAACPARKGEAVLDLGCGVGGAAFCLLQRVPECFISGIDIQSYYIELARQNIGLNNATGRCEFAAGDIRDHEGGQRVDHVICNPPFLENGAGTRASDEGLALARAHDDDDIALKDWIDAGFRALRSGGCFTIIHRADALDRIMMGFGKRFGAVEVIPLWPRVGEDARRVIVRAIKDRRSPARIGAGIVLHEADGRYTAAAERILRVGDAII